MGLENLETAEGKIIDLEGQSIEINNTSERKVSEKKKISRVVCGIIASRLTHMQLESQN